MIKIANSRAEAEKNFLEMTEASRLATPQRQTGETNMRWIVRKIGEIEWHASSNGKLRAIVKNITAPGGAEHWQITVPEAKVFNWDCVSYDCAIGYVRGLERAAKVHAEETA